MLSLLSENQKTNVGKIHNVTSHNSYFCFITFSMQETQCGLMSRPGFQKTEKEDKARKLVKGLLQYTKMYS